MPSFPRAIHPHSRLGLRAFATFTAIALAAALAALAPTGALAQVDASELNPGAPSSHTVVKGDTLWDISGKFLKSPWKWPQIWDMNREAIKDPHWIYPGDVIYLNIVDGKASLSKGKTGARGEVRLSPGVRIEDALDERLQTVSSSAIRPFLARPMIIDIDQLESAPKIIAPEDNRLYAGTGNRVYATGLPEKASGDFAIYRQGPELIDPETQLVLGYEAVHLGVVRVVRGGETALLKVIASTQEVGKGDRLVAMPPSTIFDSQLRSAAADLKGSVIKVYDGRSLNLGVDEGMAVRNYEREGGPLSVVAINRGKANGVEPGQVVVLRSTGAVVGRKSASGFYNGSRAAEPVQLPSEDNAQAVVFRTFDKVSYAIVMKASRPVHSADEVRAP